VINIKNRTVKVLALLQQYQKSIGIGIANTFFKSIVNNPGWNSLAIFQFC